MVAHGNLRLGCIMVGDAFEVKVEAFRCNPDLVFQVKVEAFRCNPDLVHAMMG
jgi:hypothetical protein